MREIKFRAWFKPQREYITWEDMHGLTREAEGKIAVHIACGDQCYAFSDEIDLEQFTGLRDKNGREIYEGDIIKYRWFWNPVDQPKDFKTQVVKYDIDKAGFYIGGVGPDPLEVIGNIHENPELLPDA